METQPQDNPENSPAPLVSVLVRSMNRPELREALQSIEQQTWPNIEIVLVDASGKGLSCHKDLTLRTPLREISDGIPRNRPAAANETLRNARGEFMLFLDEDDWIAPEHIRNLIRHLTENPAAVVAYSSTQLTAPGGKPLNASLRIGFDPARLRHDNFIPIHSALFRQSVVAAGCRFDDSLEIFEDWDFWLQVLQHGSFIHHDELTAFYRQGGDSNTASQDPSTRYQEGNPISAARVRVFQKWLQKWDGDDVNKMLGSMDQFALLDKLHADIHVANTELINVNRQLHKVNQLINRKNAELQEAKNHIDHLGTEIQLLHSSLSWRLTKPVRGLKRALIAMGAGRIKQRLLQKFNPGLPSNQKHIFFNLDTPKNGQGEFPEVLTISGWSCSVAGIDGIDASVDGQHRLSFNVGISRPDVAEHHPECPDSPIAGFYYDLPLEDLSPGEHQLELRVKDKAGHELVVTQAFRLGKIGDVYNNWYWRSTPTAGQAADSSARNTMYPDFHIAVLASDNEEAMLATIDSVSGQFCKAWKLILIGSAHSTAGERISASLPADQISQHPDTQTAVRELIERDGWTVFLQAGETLAPHALQEWANLIDEDSQLVYSDHDKRYASSEVHFEPCFTPEWAPDHLISSNYIGGVYALRNDQLRLVSPLNTGEPGWRYALLLEAISASLDVRRAPRMLWSAPGEDQSSYISEETAAVEKWLQRTHPDAHVTEANGLRHLQWPLNPTLKVSIIIPTMGKLELLRPCMESLLEKTAYPNFEVVILDNSRGQFPEGIQYLHDKGLKVIECNEPFNWARLNNVGARHAEGDLYLFLNDDIEVTDPGWLDELVRQASRPEIGAVGALLYYPNGALQHTGVLLVNYGGGAIHLLHKRTPSDAIYRKLHQTTREVSANTGACLMVAKSKFDDLNGFDEELAVVGNDVDLCLRLLGKGYRNLWTPHCSLIHHESISRKTSVPKADEKAMWKRWREHFLAGDRYYNPNLSPAKGDFSLEIGSHFNQSSSTGTPASPGTFSVLPQRLQPGVNIIGYIRAEMGIGEGARSDAKALDAADEPFGIINFETGNPSRMNDLSWQHKEMQTAPFDVTLLHINPDHAHQAISELPSSHFDGHYRIGYWAWELPVIPEKWNDAFVHFDEIWVPSVFVQEAVAMNSPVPVVRIPHAVEVVADQTLSRKDFGLPEEAFLFLSMFDTRSRPERKNPLGAIRAFQQAFAADDMSVRLVLKVNNPTPEGIRSLRKELGAHANVILLDEVYSRSKINALISNTDCFVSLHRSEGFGFGPAEAMALGKPVMATNWSGNVDYMRPGNSIPIDYSLVTLEEDYGPYQKGQVWAEPDIQCAANAMRNLASDPALVTILGQRALATIQEEFAPLPVGRMMRRRLAEIRRIRASADSPISG